MVTEIRPALAFCSLLLFRDFSSRGFSLSSSCVKPNQCGADWALWARSNQKIHFDLPWPILPPVGSSIISGGKKGRFFYLVEVSQSTPKVKYHFNSSWLWKLALQLPGVPHNPPLSKGLTLFSTLHLLSAPLLSVWMELVAQGFRSGCCLVLSRGEC